MLKTSFIVIPLVLALPAQPIVSPVGYEHAEGQSKNSFPWHSAPARYLQVHGDLRNRLRVLFRLSFRRDGLTDTAGLSARTMILELYLGEADYGARSAVFANNWISPPTRVVGSRPVSAPDWSQRRRMVPTPFDFTVMLDMPYVHAGVNDLAWEVLVTANTATGAYPADAPNTKDFVLGVGSSVMNGTGCATSRGEFELRSSFTTLPGSIQVQWTMTNGPTYAPAGVLLGVTDPNLLIPGLCGDRLRTDATLPSITGTTTFIGGWSTQIRMLPFDPNLVGAPIYAQGIAVDLSQPVFPFVTTNGLASSVAGQPPPVQCAYVYLLGSLGPIGMLEDNTAVATWFHL